MCEQAEKCREVVGRCYIGVAVPMSLLICHFGSSYLYPAAALHAGSGVIAWSAGGHHVLDVCTEAEKCQVMRRCG